MFDLATIRARFAAWQAARHTTQELSLLSDRELSDIGLHRCDIPTISRRVFGDVLRSRAEVKLMVGSHHLVAH